MRAGHTIHLSETSRHRCSGSFAEDVSANGDHFVTCQEEREPVLLGATGEWTTLMGWYPSTREEGRGGGGRMLPKQQPDVSLPGPQGPCECSSKKTRSSGGLTQPHVPLPVENPVQGRRTQNRTSLWAGGMELLQV